MRIACLLMQKNERYLLEPWVVYHSWLFGLENLFVFDNGSVDPVALDVLERYRIRGLHVDHSFHTRANYEAKGEILADTIQRLDAGDAPYDFYFPLDCDEFLVATTENGELLLGKSAISDALAPFLGDQRVLTVAGRYRNSPLHPDRYLPGEANKCFFARGSCQWLDGGYHRGRTRHTDEQAPTPVAYVEFRFRPYREYQFFARQKLRERLAEFTKPGLRAHKAGRGAGNHLVDYVLMDRQEYEASFSEAGRVSFPDLRKKLHQLGTPIGVSRDDYPEPDSISD
jgi:hypothetical protein